VFKYYLFFHVEEMEKSILDPGSDPDQCQNLIDWSFAKDLLSFRKMWFKSVNNALRFSVTNTHRDTQYSIIPATSLAEPFLCLAPTDSH